MTGCYPDYRKGKHKADSNTGHDAFRQDNKLPIQRTADDIDQALSILISTGAESVRSVSQTKAHPYWMKTLDGDRLHAFIEGYDEHTYTRRQMLPPAYMLNGAVDAVRTDVVREGVIRAMANVVAVGQRIHGPFRGGSRSSRRRAGRSGPVRGAAS